MKRRQRQPRAFTLIEVLVTISIIVIIVGFLIGGYKYLDASSRARSTRVTLHNLRAMYTESELGRGAKFELQPINGNPALYDTNPIGAPGDVYGASKPNRHGSEVARTGSLMGALLISIPNKAVISKLPKDQFLHQSNGSGEAQAIQDPPVLLDGWGNPIIYAPPGGMSGIKNRDGNLMPYSTPGLKVAPDGKGFWVSAGPDGDFSKGDDNLYSFED